MAENCMTASPQPIQPARHREVYEFEYQGATIQLPAAEVDRNHGHIRYRGVDFEIRWREVANA
jgi:hypothetical protein